MTNPDATEARFYATVGGVVDVDFSTMDGALYGGLGVLSKMGQTDRVGLELRFTSIASIEGRVALGAQFGGIGR